MTVPQLNFMKRRLSHVSGDVGAERTERLLNMADQLDNKDASFIIQSLLDLETMYNTWDKSYYAKSVEAVNKFIDHTLDHITV